MTLDEEHNIAVAPFEIWWENEWIPVTNVGTLADGMTDKLVDPADVVVCIAYDARLDKPNRWLMLNTDVAPRALRTIRLRKVLLQ